MSVKRKRKLGRAATASLAGLAVTATIGGLEAGRRLFRNAKIFTPEREPVISWNPTDYGFDPTLVDEITIRTDDGETLYGWYCRSAKPIASALFCHGKSGNFTTVAAAGRQLVEQGLDVLMFDYRGFGRSSGRASITGVVRDTVAAARRHETLRPRDLPSILYGYSLGGAIASQAIQFHPFDGLVLQSTFTSLPEMSRIAFPRLPMHLVTGHIFETYRVIDSLSIPLYVIHGSDDEIVPCAMGKRLYEMCPSARGIDIIEGGLHRNLFEIAAARIGAGVSGFVRGLAPAGA